MLMLTSTSQSIGMCPFMHSSEWGFFWLLMNILSSAGIKRDYYPCSGLRFPRCEVISPPNKSSKQKGRSCDSTFPPEPGLKLTCEGKCVWVQRPRGPSRGPAGGRLPPKMRTDTGVQGLICVTGEFAYKWKMTEFFCSPQLSMSSASSRAYLPPPHPPCTPFEEYSLLVKLGHLVCY